MVDADPEHRAFLCGALADLGLTGLMPAASAGEALALAESAPVDLCIVHAQATAGDARAARAALPDNPFDAARTPAILIAPDPRRETVRVAAALGYRVVLPSPAVPRVVYRRIGSILQKVRRANRAGPPELASAAARAAEFQRN